MRVYVYISGDWYYRVITCDGGVGIVWIAKAIGGLHGDIRYRQN